MSKSQSQTAASSTFYNKKTISFWTYRFFLVYQAILAGVI